MVNRTIVKLGIGWVLLVLLGTGWLAQPEPVLAQGECFPGGVIDPWLELSTPAGSFTILYAEINAPLANALLQTYGQALDEDYARFARLFRQGLVTPIVLRIYPIEYYYRCLNGVPPALADDQVATRLGKREIAILGDRVPPLATWKEVGRNTLRNELARLFVAVLTDEKAPPGLEAGIGYYMENPQETFLARAISTQAPEQPAQTWRELWETAALAEFPERIIPTQSIVAYLVDRYGWDSLLAYLATLPRAGHYRQALVETYQVEAGVLQEEWENYYPLYLAGRWQAHVLYSFDLSHLDAAQTRAYTCSAQELKKTMEFFESTGDAARLADAQALYDQAMAGAQAGGLARQARRALLAGEYVNALEWIHQSQALYTEVNDTAALNILAAYEQVARETLAFREEMEQVIPTIVSGPTPEQVQAFIAIGNRLGELGDRAGWEKADQYLNELTGYRQVLAQQWAVAAVVAALLLVGARIAFLLKPPLPETALAQLQEGRNFRLFSRNKRQDAKGQRTGRQKWNRLAFQDSDVLPASTGTNDDQAREVRQHLVNKVTRLYTLVVFQRTIRRLAQAAWLFGAGALLGWGLQVGWNVFPETKDWVLLGALLAAPPLLGTLIPLRTKNLMWAVDRQMGLQEQASSAWQAARRQEDSPVHALLYREATRQIQQVTRRMVTRGWNLVPDLLALGAVGILLISMATTQALVAPLELAGPGASVLDQLPPLPEDPTACTNPASNPESSQTKPPPAFKDPAGVQDLLNALGADLSKQAETEAAGAALQQGHLAQAAREFETLADLQAQLSPEARENLRVSLEKTAVEAQNAGEEQLAEDLRQAAEALAEQTGEEEKDGTTAADALDALAADLRDLGGQYAQAGEPPPGAETLSGTSTNEGPGSSAKQGGLEPSVRNFEPDKQSFSRLEGGETVFELSGGDTPAGLEFPQGSGTGAEPAPPGQTGSTVTGSSRIEGSTSPLLYSQFSWKWRHVIAKYFSP